MSEINKYNNSVIYTIECNDINLKYNYVGSTTNYNVREICHKSDCNNISSKQYNYKIYKIIRENNGWDNFTMKKIEDYSCNNKKELFLRERYYYDLLNPNLNSNCPKRAMKESNYNKFYYEINKEKLILSSKLYRDNNKDKIKNKIKEIINCCCGKNFQKREKNRHEKSIFHIHFINNYNSNI